MTLPVPAEPRVVKAGNRGPFTLDGTRCFLVGRRRAAVIDPGPNDAEHVRALCIALTEAEDLRILLTHGHGDHAGAADAIARLQDAPVLGPSSAGHHPLTEGMVVPTDDGALETISIPGHTRDHVGFYWRRRGAFFAGDLILGRGSTTWLGEYPGCVADYLSSLDRIEMLGPSVIYPAHGPAVRSPIATLRAYRAHRLERLEQVARVRRARPAATLDELVRAVYGTGVPDRLAKAARASVEVMLHHLETTT